LLVRYKGGAKGVLYASQISVGEENSLTIRVYGEKASLEWKQEYPNDLIVKYAEAPRQLLRRGNPYLSEHANKFSRIPPGHPEAFIEAFANIYLEAARAIRDAIVGNTDGGPYDFPTVDDGIEGMRFIATAVKSAKAEAWTSME
jgi:predicted dehydrogenase